MASLEQNINQVASDFRSIKEAIVAKGVEIADGTPTEEYADKIGEIKASEFPTVDEDKIIPRTISGKIVSAKDVSEVPHYITCKITGVDDPTTVQIKVIKKNLIPNNWESGFLNSSGQNQVATDFIRTIDYFRVDPCKTYYITCADSTLTINWRFYDKDKNFLKGGQTPTNRVIGKDFSIIPENAEFCRISIKSSLGIDPKVQLEYGSMKSEYEEYSEENYISNENGEIQIFSKSPCMNITTNSSDAIVEVTYHVSYGMFSQYNAIWDSIQNYGDRKQYNFCFFSPGGYWNDDTLRPKYDMVLTAADDMFYSVTNLIELKKGYFGEEDLLLDTSQLKSTNWMFYSMNQLIKLPPIDLSISTSNTGTFSNCTKLNNLLLTVSENTVFSVTSSFTFDRCNSLSDLTIIGTIGKSIHIGSSPLNKTSILSIINALSTTSSGVVTLKKTAVSDAFGTNYGEENSEWMQTIAEKSSVGWSFTLI